jgi:hypothetical protein
MSIRATVIRMTSLNLLLLLGLCVSVQAQQFAGTIRGTVRDPTGAVVPGTEVSVVNIGTNETRTVETDASGIFIAPQLRPGLYRIDVTKGGFKVATVGEVKLDVQQVREVDVTLEVGTVSETVLTTSSGDAAIETVSPTVSQTIENKRIVDLPLNGRNPFSLATLTPGVIPAAGSSPSISGGRNATSEVTIDGISNVNAENNVSILDLNYTPSVDAVQEFSVQTNSVSAEFGRLGGGVINLITKNGTNQYHFTLFEFHRNSVLDANNFFSNRAGVKRPNFKRNQFGGNAGGPIVKNKTFFFVNFEGLRQGAAATFTGTVPTAAWRNGDFSTLGIPIYDPLTTRPDPSFPGRFTRDQFQCNGVLNVICPNRISNVARNLLKFYPLPNTASTSSNQTNNFTAAGTSIANNNQIDSRVDHNFNDKWRGFVRFSTLFRAHNEPINAFGNDGTPNGDGPQDSTAKSLSIDNVYTFSSTLIGNVRYGFNRRTVDRSPFSSGFDITQLGFPASIKQVAELQALEFPRIDVNGLSSLGQNTFTDLRFAQNTHTFNANGTKIRANHTFKFGMDYRFLGLNFLQLALPSGQYGFGPNKTQRDPDRSSGGFGLASLLIGVPDSGQLSHEPNPASSSSYWGFYVEDAWKVSPKFTLTLGLRYDFDVPRTERYNQLSFFDFNAPSPLAGRVPTSAAVPSFNPANLRGAVRFVDENNRRQTPTDRNNLGPRVGFAYNFKDKTVVRGAYGIYYSASALQAAGSSGSAGMVGFSTRSNMIVNLSNTSVPINFLDNPFPNGFNLPTGRSLGDSTFLGLGVGEGVFVNFRSPLIQQWNLNLQRELPGNIVAEVAYLGSRGTDLLDGENGVVLAQLPEEFLSLGSDLNTLVPNPFFGIITNPSSVLSRSTITKGRLLRPFPQYDGVTAFRVPQGSSIYHAMTLKADKRFSKGLSFLVGYTWSKLIDDVSTTVNFLGQAGRKQNAYDRKSDRSISSQDITHRLVTSFVYDLPFGRGRTFGRDLNGPANWILGGWQFNGIAAFQSGNPLIILQNANTVGLFNSSQRPTVTGRDPNLGGRSRNDQILKWFDTSAFSITPAFTFGNAPRVQSNLRADGVKNFDLSLFKNNYFNEGKWNAQFRVEFFNAFNRVQLGAPGASVDAGNFGVIGGTANGPRQIQLALKLLF